jgi:hypothetical protein
MIIKIRHMRHEVRIKVPASRKLKKKLERMKPWQALEHFLTKAPKYDIVMTSKTTPIPTAVVSNYVFRKKHVSNDVFEEISRDEDGELLERMQLAANSHAAKAKLNLLPNLTAH